MKINDLIKNGRDVLNKPEKSSFMKTIQVISVYKIKE
jgi:hypothetical protein